MNKVFVNGMLLGCCIAFNSSAWAVDFAYYKSQSCNDLTDEYVQLKKAENAANDAIKKTEDKASRDKALGIASAFLFGFGWWSSADHSNTNQIQSEIRSDMKMVTAAAKTNKCKLPSI